MTTDPLAALFAELGRLRNLTLLECALRARGFSRIAGVDEAGRGSLAGPVVAAAVILPGGCLLPGLDDSKLLNAESRERLDLAIRARAVALSIGVVEATAIDAGDILRASLEAMRQAVTALSPAPEVILVDAVRVPGVAAPQLSIIHGDALSASIAAASIVAKVYRDGLLDALSERHPAYGFDQHKGYGTPDHWQALRRSGPCPEHRLTYRGVVPEASDAPIAGRAARRRG
ncbi:MAG: ribonuclease HII [Thermoanaerobaculia bacterium]